MRTIETKKPTAKITLFSLPLAASVFITGGLWMMGEEKGLMGGIAIIMALGNMLLYAKRNKDTVGTWVYLMLLCNIIFSLILAADTQEGESMQYLWLILALILMLVLLGHYSKRRQHGKMISNE